MEKAQAINIQRKLLALDRALQKAVDAIFEGVDKEQRRIWSDPLWNLSSRLHFEMLASIYAQYPELRPPPPRPTVSSHLRWKDVTLPKSVTEADLDAIIFAFLKPQRKKTAMVVGQAARHCEEHNLLINHETLAARIGALTESGRIESFGDLRMWGHSEIKLKD